MNIRSRPGALAGAALFILLCMVAATFLGGCGNSERQRRNAYVDEWREVITEFQKRINEDDKKAEELVNSEDLAGLVRLVDSRIENIDEVTVKVLDINTPLEMARLQAITLYYLVSLRDQLQAQNAANEAALAGQPTNDLKQIADDALARTQTMSRELALELKRLGINVEQDGGQQAPETESTGTPEIPGTAPTTAPATAP